MTKMLDEFEKWLITQEKSPRKGEMSQGKAMAWLVEAQSYTADAERYRHLKNSNTDGLFIAQYNGSFSRLTGDKADEVVDQAMKEIK